MRDERLILVALRRRSPGLRNVGEIGPVVDFQVSRATYQGEHEIGPEWQTAGDELRLAGQP